MEITHRSLTHDEALRLHHELKTTPNILGYTVRELRRLSDMQVATVGGAFAGVCFSVDLAFGWTDIAGLYVFPEFRGAGIGKTLFLAAWRRAAERGRHLYVLSRNPQVVGWMREQGMTLGSAVLFAPLPVQLHMVVHMASRHRNAEGLRKGREIKQCPPLIQGILKHETGLGPR